MKQTRKTHPRSTSIGKRLPASRSGRRASALAPMECQPQPAQEVAGAHHLLKMLQERIGDHPELEAALMKLEIALGALTVKSGGLL
jgi:hypothetical protein